MSRKIIGVTVGTQLPKPNFDQTDPSKGDYIKGDRSFLKIDDTLTQSGRPADAKVVGDALAEKQPVGDYALQSDLNALIGDAPVSEQINTAIAQHVKQPDWSQTDENAKDFIKNKPNIPKEIFVDTSFSVEGAAADAKATGDQLNNIEAKIEAIEAIENYEIDEICTVMFECRNVFADAITGEIYNLYVQNGKLKMIKVNNSVIENASAEEIFFTDITTGLIYKLYVNNGKLNMIEDENAISSFNEILLVDISTGTTYKLYVDNKKLIMTEVE